MTSRHRNPVAAGLACGALIAVTVAVLATDGFSDLVLLILAVGVLTVGYAARRYARDALLYSDRDNRQPAPAGRDSRAEGQSDMTNRIDINETARTPARPESPSPIRDSCPELAWENEGGQLLSSPGRPAPQRSPGKRGAQLDPRFARRRSRSRRR